MANRIIPFDFESHAVRVQLGADEQPWFNANDVCAALEFSNPRQAIESHVDPEDVQKMDTLTPGGRQRQNHVNESGLYALILGSAKAEAKRFKRWVTAEVLPSIRKAGAHVPPQLGETRDAVELFQPFFDVAILIGCDKQAAAISANQAVQAVSGANVLQLMGRTHIESENQDALYYTPTEIGKQIGLSAQAVNRMLVQAGLQTKTSEHWEATVAGREYSRIYDTGKKHGSGVPIQQTKWSAAVIPLLRKDAA